MKKLVSLLVVLAMLMAMAPAAFAEEAPVGDVTNPAPLVMGDNVAYVAANPEQAGEKGYYFEWVATEAGTLTIDFSDEDEGCPFVMIYVFDTHEAYAGYGEIMEAGGSASVEVEAGYLVQFGVEEYDLAEATFHFTASFAAAGGEQEGTGTEEDPWIIDTLPATVTGEFTEAEAADMDFVGHFYQYTAVEACTLDWSDFEGCGMYVQVNDEAVWDTFCNVAAGDVVLINAWCNTYAAGEYGFVLEAVTESAPAGTEDNPYVVDFEWNDAGSRATATVTVPANTAEYWCVAYGLSDVFLSINGGEAEYVPFSPWGMYFFSLANDTDEEVSFELVAFYKEGSYALPYEFELGEFSVDIPENSDNLWYTWTAEEDGVLTITLEGENWIFYIENATTGESTDYWYDTYGEAPTDSIEVHAGDVVMVMFGSQDADWNVPATTLSVTATFEAGEVGGGEGGEEGDAGVLVLGENNLEASDGESVEYTFVVEQAGTLYITVRAYGFNGVDDKEFLIDATNWATLKINGELISSLQESVEVAVGDVVTIVLTSEDGDNYFAKLQLSYEGFYVAPLGSEENPIVLDFADCPTTIEIPAGETYWVKLVGFDASVMEIYGEDAFVIQNYWSMMQGFVEETITAEDGVVVFNPGAEMIQIGNAGQTDATFEVKAWLPEGIWENPADLPVNLDPVVVELEENNNGYYFDWIATADGTLTVTVEGEYWTFVVNNLTQYTYSDSHAKTEGAENTITIEVKAGDEIQMNLGTLNIIGEYEYEWPADSITVTAVFTEAEGDDEVVLGDVNGDGQINTTDAKLVMQYELGLVDENALNLDVADVNGDGEYNTTDAKLIMQLELGLIAAFPTA